MISDAGEDGFAVQLKQGTKLIATIARNYNPKSIGLLSPPLREAHAIKESLLALRTQIIGSHVHCLTDSLVAVQLSKKNMDKGGKLLHRISAELDQFDLSFEHVPRNDPRIKVVDELGRDEKPKLIHNPKKARYMAEHDSNGYYFRTMINDVDIDCMIDSGAALSLMRRRMAEDMRLNIIMLDEPRLFFGSHPFECHSYAIAELDLGPNDETISVKFYLVDGDQMFGPDTDDCILGQDFLQEYATEWDFNNQTICLAQRVICYEKEEAGKTKCWRYKWVFNRKFDEFGTETIWKARLVIGGQKQQEGIDYDLRSDQRILFIIIKDILFHHIKVLTEAINVR
jgi:hypothetical protein